MAQIYRYIPCSTHAETFFMMRVYQPIASQHTSSIKACGYSTPLKINMERRNHQIEKENHLNQTSMTLGSMLIFPGVSSHDTSSSGFASWFKLFLNWSDTPPHNQHRPWKCMVGSLLSFWETLFSGAMLVSVRVIMSGTPNSQLPSSSFHQKLLRYVEMNKLWISHLVVVFCFEPKEIHQPVASTWLRRQPNDAGHCAGQERWRELGIPGLPNSQPSPNRRPWKRGEVCPRKGDSFWKTSSRWWFQICFIFIPIWENDPNLLIFFKWVETTN